MREGDDADAMFIIVSGRCRVVQKSEGGEEIILSNLGPGTSSARRPCSRAACAMRPCVPRAT